MLGVLAVAWLALSSLVALGGWDTSSDDCGPPPRSGQRQHTVTVSNRGRMCSMSSSRSFSKKVSRASLPGSQGSSSGCQASLPEHVVHKLEFDIFGHLIYSL